MKNMKIQDYNINLQQTQNSKVPNFKHVLIRLSHEKLVLLKFTLQNIKCSEFFLIR